MNISSYLKLKGGTFSFTPFAGCQEVSLADWLTDSQCVEERRKHDFFLFQTDCLTTSAHHCAGQQKVDHLEEHLSPTSFMVAGSDI